METNFFKKVTTLTLVVKNICHKVAPATLVEKNFEKKVALPTCMVKKMRHKVVPSSHIFLSMSYFLAFRPSFILPDRF
jgi:hypothetical protein